MATKYGMEAIIAWAKRAAAFKATRNTIAVIVAVAIVWVVLEHYVF